MDNPVSEKKTARATIMDIAREANVSLATVSRVLNDADYPVKDVLRKRVKEAADRLDYRPNIFSQMLKGAVCKEIGIIVPDLINPFYAQLVSSVAKRCVAHGFAPIVCSSYDSPALENRQIDILLRQQVAGILLSTIGTGDSFPAQLNHASAPPVILFDQSPEGDSRTGVSFDFFKGGYMAANYLIQCGHQEIAFVSPMLDRSSRKMIYEGYCKALEDAKLPLHDNMVLIAPVAAPPGNDALDFDGDADFHNGKVLTEMLLQCETLPDAVMTINDITAIGMINELSRRGVRVPKDISVIGFDNIPVSAMITPALTTIEQPAGETGSKALALLFERIGHPELPHAQIMIEPKLIVRQSVRKKKKQVNSQEKG